MSQTNVVVWFGPLPSDAALCKFVLPSAQLKWVPIEDAPAKALLIGSCPEVMKDLYALGNDK
ncbi:hypothetical protein N7468_005688 [Penicillium chermesinum]|uniref:Uncharacterized protein n=1 Tax=Penicillium chermesinum TaxID=63820 RepID=A0A9W9TNG2_9EURO|nr:uncharacterized protein N7468_005688 [Penicillium chermesinum]KAJ5232732.1 hypothetical protein N7468_005688 [Penicillium chermesinum]KAJ6172392.1 hypothetical protein N7470_001459 [Penicillium chermesinum]